MISLIDVSRYHGPTTAPHLLLDRINLRIEARARIGILAGSGAGKSTLARIMGGHEKPDEGHVVSTARLSWPIGFSAGFHPALSPAQNTSIVAGLWNLDPVATTMQVEDFADVGDQFHRPIGQIAPGQKTQIAQALSLAVDFETYLADDMNVSANQAFREKCETALSDRLESSGLVILSRHTRMLDQFAKEFFALTRGRLIQCSTALEAKDVLEIIEDEEVQHYASA